MAASVKRTTSQVAEHEEPETVSHEEEHATDNSADNNSETVACLTDVSSDAGVATTMAVTDNTAFRGDDATAADLSTTSGGDGPSSRIRKGSDSTIQRLPPGEDIDIHELALNIPRPHQAELTASLKKLGQMVPGRVYRNPTDDSRQLVVGVTRRIGCREVGIDFLYEEFWDLGEYATIDELIIADYEASRHDRKMSKEQRILNAARFCKRVFIPVARKNMLGGKSLPRPERLQAHKKAAEVEGVAPNAVRNGLKVLDTPLVDLCETGKLKLSAAARYKELEDDEKADVHAALEREDIETIQHILMGDRVLKDKTGQEIPSDLIQIFELRRPCERHAKALRAAAGWLNEARPIKPTRLLRDLKWDSELVDYAGQLESAVAYCVCPYCKDLPAPKRTDCPKCAGSRVLTEYEYEAYKRDR